VEVCDVDRETAKHLLAGSGGSVKTAIVMHMLQLPRADAERALEEAGGVVRRVLKTPPPPVR
jgi:N-acetylmuramic acid 6-phosphate (MurNAc-6-P) etherase